MSGLSTVLPAIGSVTSTPFCSIGAIEHHDDEQHQHDVDERRHVDVGLQAAFCAANIHCHEVDAPSSRLEVGLRCDRSSSDRLRRLLDEVVDQLRRRVVHFDVEVLDAAGQVVVEPDRRDRDDEPERGFDERFRDTGRDRAETARAGGRDALERGDDADDRAEQSDERRRRADGRERRDALLQVVGGQRRGALNGAADGVDQVFTAQVAAALLLELVFL